MSLNGSGCYEPPCSHVMVIYTGGTIGMVPSTTTGSLAPTSKGVFQEYIRQYPNIHDVKWQCHVAYQAFRSRLDDYNGSPEAVGNAKPSFSAPLCLPPVRGHQRVLYTIYEYDPLLDSSDMKMDGWQRIACDIARHYNAFDGFVILHGTDTLAYTASALSFMLQKLTKPIIVTGSQIPVFETRSDGRDNFVGALIFAGCYNVPEVCVYFSHQLLRGNRATKSSSVHLDAFESPNCDPIALVEATIEIKFSNVIYQPPTSSHIESSVEIRTDMCDEIALIRMYPSITSKQIEALLCYSPTVKGAVIQCYGAGNLPSTNADLMKTLKNLIHDRRLLVIAVTQCARGGMISASATQMTYESGGSLLSSVGIVSGGDMTTECALAKLAHVLARNDLSAKAKRSMMATNLAGEMTVTSPDAVVSDVGCRLRSHMSRTFLHLENESTDDE